MGSPRPSYKELRSRKVAIGSNSLEVESRKVEVRSQTSRSRSLLRSKYSKRWGRIVCSIFDRIYHLIYMEIDNR